MNRELVSKSKFLSLVLRHDPGTIGLVLDANGWADVDQLLAKAQAHRSPLTREQLVEIVASNEKKRFDLDLSQNRIRANQGHSIEVDLQLTPATPPAQLFHGTAARNLVAILEEGLSRQGRQHVHLSLDVATAKAVGSRHGEPIVLVVAAGLMHGDGFAFYCSKNGVWLTDHVPAKYIKKV